MKVKSESQVAQSCLTLRDPMDCSLPASGGKKVLWFAKQQSQHYKAKFRRLDLGLDEDYLMDTMN